MIEGSLVRSEEFVMIPKSRLHMARYLLGEFVLAQAYDTSGPGYTACETAPSSYEGLVVAWQHALATGTPLPVWAGGSDKTIYLKPSINHAGRYWHDAVHIELGADFSLAGELQVAAHQLHVATEHFGAGSLEVLLLAADTVGQILHYAKSGMFVEDQLTFALAFMEA